MMNMKNRMIINTMFPTLERSKFVCHVNPFDLSSQIPFLPDCKKQISFHFNNVIRSIKTSLIDTNHRFLGSAGQFFIFS